VSLLLSHPEVAFRSCEDCKRHVYDPKTGRRHTDRNTGRPLRRPPKARPPCAACPKCRDDTEKTPEVGGKVSLSPKNRRTLQCYYEQLAGGGVVTDPITRKNLGIIAELFDQHDRGQRQAAIATAAAGRVVE